MLHGWLPAALPAEARRFRSADRQLAETLADAGAELVDRAPDVEIADAGDVRGDAMQAIVCIDEAQPEGGSLLVRAPRRALASGRTRLRAAGARRAIRRRGYRDAQTLMWDLEHFVWLPDVRVRLRGHTVAELLPQRAVVVGRRDGSEPTLLDAVVSEAGSLVGGGLRHGWPLARAAMMVVVCEQAVLRLSVGRGRAKLERQQAALDALRATDPEPVIADRLPWALGQGRTGLADWSLDTKLVGATAGARLPPSLLADCVDFLVALHRAGQRPPPDKRSIASTAEIVAAVATRDGDAQRLRALGAALEERLRDVPRGYGHGDFWTRNLLVAGDRLTGVIDWDGADPDCLPLVDLLHLRLSARREQTREYLGAALVSHLLPWAKAGGDDIARGYAQRIGLRLEPDLLEAIVVAYWLARLAFEIEMFSDRVRRPVWLRGNVDAVVDVVSHGSHPWR